MTETVVVLGAGYAGAGAIQRLEAELRSEVDITWVSEHDYHLILHEVHRCVRDPGVREKITIPVKDIKAPSTRFVEGRVVDVDVDERDVVLADGQSIDFDYLLVALGSRTAFFDIDGLEDHAHTLKSVADAVGIHDAVVEAATQASPADPAQIVIGGAGLSGIQVAGEIAAFRDHHRAPIDITIVEGLDEVYPQGDAELQVALRNHLEAADVTVKTSDFIEGAHSDCIDLESGECLDYDVLVWAGGITGQEAIRDVDLRKDNRSYRINAKTTFQTSDDRVFAIGDAALIDQPRGEPAPPTAEAAWDAAKVAAENVTRAVRGQPLQEWSYTDKGTVVSIGDDAIAHDVVGVPISTFGGLPAEILKKAIAARWISDVTSVSRALRAWSAM
jgi:NADH dehydrogenase